MPADFSDDASDGSQADGFTDGTGPAEMRDADEGKEEDYNRGDELDCGVGEESPEVADLS